GRTWLCPLGNQQGCDLLPLIAEESQRGGAGQPAPIPMNPQPDDVSAEESQDDWCPECGGDDVIELDDGNLWCPECRAVIDY
ncbi:hypothetical protein, partial [Stenotrophomonas maltophilia]|uniref:hypothetical protein n=1 Tax=Stenotrophomonas maltophilia TaxID=40324 RepID=UPI001A7E05A5